MRTKRSPPETPEKPPPKRINVKPLNDEAYEKALNAIFTGTEAKVKTDVNTMPAAEIVKRYISASGKAKMKDGSLKAIKEAKRGELQSMLLHWVSFNLCTKTHGINDFHQRSQHGLPRKMADSDLKKLANELLLSNRYVCL